MHYTTQRFWKYYNALPESVQKTADPSHPSLHFKKLGNKYWSVRAGLNYRALGVEVENGISWFWIGTHTEYDKLIGKL